MLVTFTFFPVDLFYLGPSWLFSLSDSNMVLYKHGIEYQKAHIEDDRRPDIIACYVLCISAAWLFVILRFMARRRTKTPMKLEDTMICIALVRRLDILWFLIDEYAPALGFCKHVFNCFFPRYFRSKLPI